MITSRCCFAENNQYYNSYYNNYDEVIYDPLESLNKQVFLINMTLDKFILEPIAIIYERGVHKSVKARLNNFLDNLSVPISFTNNVLQKNAPSGLYNFWRFVINITLGLGGFCDVASKMGIPENKQTFGNTLAYYGVKPGPYIVLPLIGSTSMRDLIDKFVNGNLLLIKTYNLGYVVTISTDLIIKRAKLIPFVKQVKNMSIDQYATIRSIYYQRRQSQIDELISNKK